MELTKTHNESINKFVALARNHKSQVEHHHVVADAIGELDREQYFALLAEWKETFKYLSGEIRNAKVLRKTSATATERNHWNFNRHLLKSRARLLMHARAGIKEIARRHWQNKNQDVKISA